MALLDILIKVARELGANINDTKQKALWTANINIAAKNLYDMYDLYGSLREQVFDIDTTSRTATLPYYVGKIRGVRNYDTLSRIKQMDMRPRFFYGSWKQPFLSWRDKGIVPNCQDIVNASQLTISILEAETSQFQVIVEGSTSRSDRLTEVVTFNVGEINKSTTNQFTNEAPSGAPQGLRSIRKTRPINSNLEVRDVNGILIAEIASQELFSSYKLIQVSDYDQLLNAFPCFEMLYKVRFTPFVDDYSTFPCSDMDDPIYWKTAERYYSLKKDDESTKLALGAAQTCKQLMYEITKDHEAQVEKEMQFQPNPYLNIIDSSYMLPYGFPYNPYPA